MSCTPVNGVAPMTESSCRRLITILDGSAVALDDSPSPRSTRTRRESALICRPARSGDAPVHVREHARCDRFARERARPSSPRFLRQPRQLSLRDPHFTCPELRHTPLEVLRVPGPMRVLTSTQCAGRVSRATRRQRTRRKSLAGVVLRVHLHRFVDGRTTAWRQSSPRSSRHVHRTSAT